MIDGDNMTTIATTLSDPAYIRSNRAAVVDAFDRLDCTPSDDFRGFFEKYAGPFGSSATGFVLLDVVDQDVNIETETMAAREEFGFPPRYLVLTELLGNAVLVYDCSTDAVFNVDFEGGDDALLAGTLTPAWATFSAFLDEYFRGA
jgi:hypothetical protein